MAQFEKLRVLKHRVRIFNAISVIFFSTLLVSCVSGSYIVAGNRRPSISPSSVIIYFEPPEKYETLGSVEASKKGMGTLKRQKRQDKIINKLKDMAAEIGANGVLLSISEDKVIGTSGGAVGGFNTGYYGKYFGGFGSSRIETKRTAEGRAIYVIEEARKAQEGMPTVEAENDLKSKTLKIFDQLKYDGYSINVKKNVNLKQREFDIHEKYFYGNGRREYIIICFSEDPNVLEIGLYLKRNGKIVNNYPTDRGEIAMISFKPKIREKLEVVTTNLLSRTPDSASGCRIIIAFKE